MGMEVRTDEAKAGGFQRWNPLKRAKQLQMIRARLKTNKGVGSRGFSVVTSFFFGFLSDIGMAWWNQSDI